MASQFTRKTELGSASAPIQRKNKKKVIRAAGPAYNPKSVLPGIRHVVEGRSNLNYRQVEANRMRVLGESRKNAGDSGRQVDVIGKKGRRAQEYNKGIDKQIAQFGLIDDARSKLRTIADPEETQSIERKRAARRRMRGRLGTMLSGDKETLG